jgi:hypothetical protein
MPASLTCVRGLGGATLRLAAGVALLLLVATSTTACTVTGSATAVRQEFVPPDRRHVDVSMWITDNFNILADGTCEGRAVWTGVRNGARVEVRGSMRTGKVLATASATTRYVHDSKRDPNPENHDDQYCLVTFSFVPSNPDGDGYSVRFFQAPRGVPGPFETPIHVDGPFGGFGYGPVNGIWQSCVDYDAPPHRPC